MLKFNEQEYRTSADLIRGARPAAEKAADIFTEQGYSNIIFTAVGGSLAPMMAIGEIAKQLTTIPVYIEQAGELLVRENVNLTKDSIIVTLSKSGDTKETVAVAKLLKEKGCRVISFTKNPESPLALLSDISVPMLHENGVEYEYMLLYWFFFRMLSNKGDFADYAEFADQMMLLPEDLIEVKEQFEPKAKASAEAYALEPYQLWIGSGETWGETYLFSMCLLEEMQWIRTKSVTSSEFFHGTIELVDEDTPVFLVKGEGKCRVIDERVEKFLKKYGKKIVIIDSKDYALKGIDDKYRWLLAPLMISSCLVDRMAFNFEAVTGHDLDFRRYYRQFEY
ncbi:MAG: SIS domain-containing protein [Erysipelotrichaceae bacterium]